MLVTPEKNRRNRRLAVVLAKAPYRVTDSMVRDVLGERDAERFLRILAWSSYAAARRFASLVAARSASKPMDVAVTAAA